MDDDMKKKQWFDCDYLTYYGDIDIALCEKTNDGDGFCYYCLREKCGDME